MLPSSKAATTSLCLPKLYCIQFILSRYLLRQAEIQDPHWLHSTSASWQATYHASVVVSLIYTPLKALHSASTDIDDGREAQAPLF